MGDARLQAMKGGIDLNGKMGFRANSGGNLLGATHEHWQDTVRPADGLSAFDYFARIVERHGSDRYVKSLACTGRFRVMALAPLTYRESLRDNEGI